METNFDFRRSIGEIGLKIFLGTKEGAEEFLLLVIAHRGNTRPFNDRSR